MRINCKKTFLIGATVASLAAINAQAGLTHRYSFTDNKDSVGGANATFVNVSTSDHVNVAMPSDTTGTKFGVFLENLGSTGLAADKPSSNPTGQYVSLPTTLLNNHKSLTIEFWTDLGNYGGGVTAGTWSRVFDFGDTNHTPGQGWNYIMFAPRSGGNTPDSRLEFNLNGAGVVTGSGSPLLEYAYHHVACVFDCTNGFIEYYLDGVKRSHDTTSYQITNVAKMVNWLGRSEWGNDAYLYGYIDEFRTYDRALSGVEVAANFMYGSDATVAQINTPDIATKLGALQKVNVGSDMNITELTGTSVSPTGDFANQTGVSIFNATGFTLTSSDTTVATITQGGVIRGLKPGKSTITVSYGGKTASLVLTVDADTAKPTVTGIDPKGYDRYLQVKFSKTLDKVTAETAANYVINGGAQKVVKAVLNTNDNSVGLFLEKVNPSDYNTITISGVKDIVATPNVMDSVTMQWLPAAGSPLNRRFYYNTASKNDDKVSYDTGATSANTFLTGFNITSNPNFPDKGGTVRQLTDGLDNGGGFGDNYVTVIDGLFLPPESGSYKFYLASDDDCGLYVSTDATAANLPTTYTSSEAGWAGTRKYSGSGSGGFVAQQNPVTLEAGRKYYFRAINRNGTGGDNFAIGWQTPSMSAPPADDSHGIQAQYLADPTYTPTAMTIKTQPADTLVNVGNDAIFTVVTDSKPGYTGVQWYRNGVAVTNGGNAATLTVPQVKTADNNATFYAVVSNLVDSVTTATAKLTVNSDTTPPAIASVLAARASAAVDITVGFSKRLNSSTVLKGNFTIDGGITVSTATFDTNTLTNVFLKVTPALTPGKAYVLTVSNIKDVPGNTIPANSKFTFHAADYAIGYAVFKLWDGFNSDPTTAVNKDQNNPMTTITSSYLGTPSWANGDNYVGMSEGIIIPPTTGDYTFYVSSDDSSRFSLSTDADPANLVELCSVSGWSNQREWTKMASQMSTTVALTAGQKYFYRGVWQDGTGGDGISVGWVLPNTTAIVDVGGSSLATLANGDLSTVTINLDLPATMTANEGVPATFTINATGNSQFGTNLLYQWFKNNAPIAGATAASYTTAKPGPYFAESGAKYYCVVSEPLLSKTSSVCTLTVIQNPEPLTALSAGAFLDDTTVGIRFNHVLDPAVGIDAANFTIPGFTVQSVAYLTNALLDSVHGDLLALTLDKQISATAKVSYKGIKDAYGNPGVGSVDIEIVSDIQHQDVGTPGTDPLVAGTVIAAGKGSFQIKAGGDDIWNAADAFNFVYLQRSGDFQAVARVANVHGSDNWAKSGLMIRESLSADSMMIYNVVTWPGGQNSWAAGERVTAGAGAQGFPGVGAGDRRNPQYPNVWVKLVRKGTVYSGYSSTDGKIWELDYQQDAGAPALSSTVFVGICVTSHNNGADSWTKSDVFDFSVGDVVPDQPPTLTVTLTASGVEISWDSVLGAGLTLKSSTDLQNWGDSGLTPVDDGKTSKVTINPSGSKFYQLMK